MIDRNDLASVLAGLYRSEINVAVGTLWDGGWDVAIGDRMNGFRHSTTIACPTVDPSRTRTLEEVRSAMPKVANWLHDRALVLFPDSLYAKEQEDVLGSVVLSIKACARCESDGHHDLVFRPFGVPVEISGTVLTHWGTCPTTGDPILLMVGLDAPAPAE